MNETQEKDRLLTNLQTGEVIPPQLQPGYYPGYQILGQQEFWDDATRRAVLSRLEPPPVIRFFSTGEANVLECVCNHILPQDDRELSRRIPIVPFIDQRLAEKKIPGFRFANMPPDGDAYRLALRAFNQMAQENFQKEFLTLRWREQEEILKSIHDGKPTGARKIWAQLPADRYWTRLVEDCAEVYYAHPWSWDEIGFGGPAYPRAYTRLERGEPEYWEVEESRYEWKAPSAALSDAEGPKEQKNGSSFET